MLSRRTLLASGAAFLATPAVARRRVTINLYNPHTHETAALRFDDTITSQDWAAFCSITRDWRTNTAAQMDAGLLRWLKGLTEQLGEGSPFHLVSGYRTPATNSSLPGTATHSPHMDGKALDLRRTDVSTRTLRDAAFNLRLGGVGYYPELHNNFVHVDTNAWRTW